MAYLAEFIRGLAGKPFFVLDTETTGLKQGEIVSIAILDHTGKVRLDTLIKPVMAIPPEATAIHGITAAMCEDAPRWSDVAPKLVQFLQGQNLVIYNAVYDRSMMHQSAERNHMTKIEWKELVAFHCCMEAFAEFYGAWNEYKGSYTWQKLVTAAAAVGYPNQAAHNALADCKMTLAVTNHLLTLNPEDYDLDYPANLGDEL